MRIDNTLPGSPAQQSGLQPGDILIQLAGQPVSDLASYTAILRGLKAREKVELRYRREDAVMVVEVVLVKRYQHSCYPEVVCLLRLLEQQLQCLRIRRMKFAIKNNRALLYEILYLSC